MQRGTVLITFLTVVGLLLLVAGLTIHWIAPSMMNDKVSEALVLTNGSQTYEAWKEPPVPVFMEFYFFNITNVNDVLNNNVKPNLTQIGPFTYKELRIKTDIEFSEDGEFVDYRQKKYFVFDREKSVGPEDMWFMGVNIPMLSVAHMLKDQLTWGSKVGLNLMLTLQGVHLFQNYTVKDYLWGYTDPFFANAKTWLKKFGKDDIAAQIPDKVGLFVGDKANGTDDGLWRIHTGKNDINKFNKIVSWNGQESVNFWNSAYANQINGTDGSMWHPFLKKTDELFMFSGEVCRSASVLYNKNVVHKGLNLWRFTINPDLMASADRVPKNADFCTPAGNCLKEGVLNMSVCMQGAPLIMSQPHFSGAHPDYINGVVGMRPSPELQTRLDIDPLTGAVLHAVKHLQFNILISPLDTFPDTLEMNTTVYPLLWVNETGGISDFGATMFKKMVYGPIMMVDIAAYSLKGLGAFILVVIIFIITCRTIRKCTKSEDRSVVFNTDIDGVSAKKGKELHEASQGFLMKHTVDNEELTKTKPLNNVNYKGYKIQVPQNPPA